MPLVTSTPLFEHARKNRYAVPAFNANSYEMIPALIHAAEAERSPLILQIGKKYLSYVPADEVASLALYLAKKAAVPVCVHLDHGADLAMARACLESGFTSVMYDGSSLPDEENIRNTREVVQLAAQYGVPVEGEIGQVLQAEDVPEGEAPDFLTDPQQALRFVQETGVSSVAVAVGNIHHMKKKQAKIDFPRIQKLREIIHIPLVVHGCSGVSDADVGKAVRMGINKVNVATEYNLAFTDGLREFTTQRPEEFFPMDPISSAMEQVTAIARGRIRVLGANGRY